MGEKIYLKISKSGKHLFLCVDQQAPSAMLRAVCMHRLEESCIRSKSAWTGLDEEEKNTVWVSKLYQNIALKMVNTCGKSGLLVRINSFQLKKFLCFMAFGDLIKLKPHFHERHSLSQTGQVG